jgi:hypothetical protein
MDFGSILRDYVAPAAGAYFGGSYGDLLGLSPEAGAGLGAAFGRGAGGLATGEDSGSTLQNSLFAGALGYGGTKMGSGLFDKNFSSMGDATTLPTTGGGSGLSFGGLSGGSMLPMLIGGGLLSDYVSGSQKKDQEEEYNKNVEKQLAQYLSKTTWNPETRANYATGLGGQYNDLITGATRRTAAVGSEAGRGGGFFSNKTAQAKNAANTAIADAIGKTYQPDTTDPSVYTSLAKAGTSPLPASNSLLTGLSATAGKWPLLYLLGKNGGI